MVMQQPWDSAHEMSPGGSKLVRHKRKTTPLDAGLGPAAPHVLSEEDMQAITAHIETHLGEVETVLCDMAPDELQIDINVAHLRAATPTKMLCTMGMSALPMTVPPTFKAPKHAELYIFLPADWPLSDEGLKKHGLDAYWPIRWLTRLARFPNQCDTFFAMGHTIPSGDPPMPLSPNCPFAGFAIVRTPDESAGTLKLPTRDIEFYLVAPLYPEEMTLKLNKGMDALLDAFETTGIDPEEIANPKRPNAAKP